MILILMGSVIKNIYVNDLNKNVKWEIIEWKYMKYDIKKIKYM